LEAQSLSTNHFSKTKDQKPKAKDQIPKHHSAGCKPQQIKAEYLCAKPKHTGATYGLDERNSFFDRKP
jgi:hypothetical protein